ncbi:MAG TPA: 2TM domain-containing protein [Jatrophihabitantaceae bacterium]
MTTNELGKPPAVAADDGQLRERAVKQLKKRRDFGTHLLVYVLVNTFIVVIWVITTSGGFFWPIFPMVGWGIGVVMNAWDVWRGDELAEEDIEKEMRRLAQRQRRPRA